MSLPIQTISPLRERMLEDMTLRKLSDKTQSAYVRAVRGFAGYWAAHSLMLVRRTHRYTPLWFTQSGMSTSDRKHRSPWELFSAAGPLRLYNNDELPSQ